jgi:hypothetical protein
MENLEADADINRTREAIRQNFSQRETTFNYHNCEHYPLFCFYLKRRFGDKSSLRTAVFYIKDRTTDSVQNCDSYINILSSQTSRS